MITRENLKNLLDSLGFIKEGDVRVKHFPQGDFELKVDFGKSEFVYPESKGFKINERQTCNFTSNENFVVFECVHRLLSKGYKPEHIELEPKWKVGHGASGGRADVLVRNQEGKPLLLIECKTAGREFEKAWKETQIDGGQLFSYIEQEKDVEFVCLYASGFDESTRQINLDQRIVSHKDNDKILADDPKLQAFRDAKNVKERFRVWKDTYKLEYTEKGIFEENIQAYQIGKDKYTLNIDTKPIGAGDKKGKYHQFRTILRKHNVSRRENAFEVLVNLFLCKLVDEIENAHDLKFYWKGIAYDNYFDLVDRLQELYKIGMERFLQQEITYVSNDEIEQAFWPARQDRNAVERRVKDLFRSLKYFNDNIFSFVNVRNKQGFEKNAKILLEIIQMWQGLRLKDEGQNQFLGDMFEYFLDNGVKQSEGQFFTPIPICKFIVSSLPLETLLIEKTESLRAIDYACGAGHFLTEYAMQIKPLVRKYKQADPDAYCHNIFGIEKEDRLAKVAKVSAFMYGLDGIQILDADALATNPEIKDESFDVLVANPPFAVEDFLLTLEEGDRERFELLQSVADLGNKNIQCFFIERARQILAPGGVVGIIVPSSVLSNSDAMHIKTREILLRYFDFIAIVELGSGTFGKTGTNTVVLFLRRKPQRPEPAEHYQNRALDFFENWEAEKQSGGGAYLDVDVVQRYCQHIEIPFDAYQTLLTGQPSDELLATEMFKDYETHFDKSTETANRRKQKSFKDLSPAEQKSELDGRFLKYLIEIELDKLYYFMLANANPQSVLLVKSPTDNAAQKLFLGYEWSGAKGNEGIKYNGGETVLDIQTPLFDPKQPQDISKINYLIQQNFGGKAVDVPENLLPFVSFARLEGLLDFSRKDFGKAISLSIKKKTLLESKWELAKLSSVIEIISGGTPDTNKPEYWNGDIYWLSVADFNSEDRFVMRAEKTITELGLANSSTKYLNVGDLIISARGTVGALAQLATPMTFNQSCYGLRAKNEKIDSGFLYYILKQEVQQFKENATGVTFGAITISTFDSIKIPLPPLAVQQQIVDECEAVDEEVRVAKKEIEKFQKEIELQIGGIYSKGYAVMKLSEICEMQAGKFVSASEINDEFEEGLYPCFGGNGLRGYTKTFTHEGTFPLVGRQGALCGNVHKVQGKFHATEHAVVVTPDNRIDVIWLFYQLKSLNLNQYAKGVAQPGLSIQKIITLTTPVPPLAEQQKLVAAVEALEKQISGSRQVIASAAGRKQAILKKYL